jgi:FMN phosphatase YigB (HAD superfamily)
VSSPRLPIKHLYVIENGSYIYLLPIQQWYNQSRTGQRGDAIIKGVVLDLHHTLIKCRYGINTLKLILKEKDYEYPIQSLNAALKLFSTELIHIYADEPDAKKSDIAMKANMAVMEYLKIEKDKQKIMARYIADNWDRYRNIGLYKDVVPALARLKRDGIKLFVLSRYYRADVLEQMNIVEYFTDVFSSISLGHTKTEAESYREIARAAGMSAEMLCNVDDEYEPLIFSEKAGMFSLLLDRRHKYAASGFRSISTLARLPGLIKEYNRAMS